MPCQVLLVLEVLLAGVAEEQDVNVHVAHMHLQLHLALKPF